MMRSILLLCFFAFATLGCTPNIDCEKNCGNIEFEDCDLKEDIDYEILQVIVDLYSVPALVVQQTPVSEFQIDIEREQGTCDSLMTDVLVGDLNIILQEEKHWCSNRLNDVPMVTDIDIFCYTINRCLDELLDRVGVVKFLRVSPPVIDDDRALVYLLDSDCEELLMYLERIAGEWTMMCMTTLTVC